MELVLSYSEKNHGYRETGANPHSITLYMASNLSIAIYRTAKAKRKRKLNYSDLQWMELSPLPRSQFTEHNLPSETRPKMPILEVLLMAKKTRILRCVVKNSILNWN